MSTNLPTNSFARTLAAGDLTAVFLPGRGMLGASLRRGSAEILRCVDDLKAAIERKFGKQVNLTIQEVRQPDLDAQLVAESIAQQIEKRVAPKRAIRQAIQRTMRMGARGVKILVSGRLGGAEMARRETDKQGKIPLHTLRADIDYGFAEARTTYGNIGVKAWVYRGDILPDQRRMMKENVQPEPFLPRAPRRADDRRGGAAIAGEAAAAGAADRAAAPEPVREVKGCWPPRNSGTERCTGARALAWRRATRRSISASSA